MTMTTARKLERIRRYSTSLCRLARFMFVVGLLGATVSLLFLLLAPDRWNGPLNVLGIQFTGFAASGTVRALAVLMVVLSAGVFAKFFIHINKLFGLYAKGVLFTAESVAQIRQIGVTLLLITAVWVVGALASFVFGEGLPPDAHIALVAAPFGQLTSGLIVVFISWIADLARELREEQELVV